MEDLIKELIEKAGLSQAQAEAAAGGSGAAMATMGVIRGHRLGARLRGLADLLSRLALLRPRLRRAAISSHSPAGPRLGLERLMPRM